MPTSLDPLENQLLAALPEAELQRWLPELEFVEMHLGDVWQRGDIGDFAVHGWWIHAEPCGGAERGAWVSTVSEIDENGI
jgi:hypothetical protein